MGLVATTLKSTVGNYVVLNIMTVQITNMRAKFKIKLLDMNGMVSDRKKNVS